MEKKNYIKISFINCGLDYDYTYVEHLSDVADYLTLVESDLMDYDPKDHEEYGKPQVIIEPVELTDREFKIFIKSLWDEA